VNEFKECVLFGGCGFIGTHLARHLLATGCAQRIVLADIKPPAADAWPEELQRAAKDGRIVYVAADVREPLNQPQLPARADLIVNLAAIHREPGHETEEYYATNLPGAENVCAYAERAGCPWMVFTSSIAPYGPTETPKSEESLTVPITPYGGSKLVAEKMHLAWQRAGPGRLLTIVRPGVVFGSFEGGNVTRLVQAVLRGRFCYMGNRHTRKAGGYVKELCRALTWVMERQQAAGEGVVLFNFTMDPPPTVEDYVETVRRVAGKKRWVPSLPYVLLLGIAHALDAVSRPFGIKQPISPVRIRKLVHSNNIVPGYLHKAGYQFQYTLDAAMADWHRDNPREWLEKG